MLDTSQKMKEYNKLITKLMMAELFYDDANIEYEIKEKFNLKLQSVTKEIENYLNYFDDNKIQYTDSEALEGFNIDFRVARYAKYNY